MRCSIAMMIVTAAFCVPRLARGQVPFFNPGVSAFSPEISVVNSGVLNDVQATVSADRKYVTLTMRPQNSQLLALQEFTFQTPLATAGGFVGGVQFKAQTGEFGAVNQPVVLSPGRGAMILAQRGMTRILTR